MSDRKRILVIDNLAVESARREVYRQLAMFDNFEVHLLVPEVWKETAMAIRCEPEANTALHVHQAKIIFGFRHHRVLYRGLLKLLRDIRPDFLLAIHAPENYATVQILLSRRLIKHPIKLTLFASRNIDLPAVGFPYRFSFLSRLCDWATSQAGVDAVFHRPKEFGYLYDRYAGRTTFIPHHVDCAIFKPTTSREKKHDSKVYTIGYVGRLVRAKGVHLLIEACSRLPSNVRLLIVGEGEEDVHLRNLAAIRGINDRVELQSPIRYAEMPDLLNRFDTLVLPSLKTSTWTELFGRVLIEAMACGIPVVASDSGGIPEVVGESGLLFETGNVSSLTGRLSELLTNLQLRNELGAGGRLRVQKLFDVPVVMKQLKNAIEQML